MDETKVRESTRREDDVLTGSDVETEASDLKRKEYECRLRDLHVTAARRDMAPKCPNLSGMVDGNQER